MALSRADFFYHSPTRYAKHEEPVISPEEASCYGRLSKLTHDGQLVVFWNSETSSRPGLFSHASAAKGYSMTLSKDTPLSEFIVQEDASEPRFLLSSRWFAHTAVLQIPPEAIPAGMRESDMADVIAKLAPRLRGSSRNFRSERTQLGASILNISATNVGAKDSVSWSEAVHGHGNFAGLFKEHSKSLGMSNRYHLVVRSDSDLIGEMLTGFAIEHPKMLLGEFAASPQMDAVRSYSQRNSGRLLAVMADALALDRKRVSIVPDLHAVSEPLSEPAEIASDPFVDTVSNLFYDPIPTGKNLVYYNATSRMNTLNPRDRRVAMLTNPNQGLRIFTLDPQREYHTMRHNVITGHAESHLISHANPHSALPTGLGRLQGDPDSVLKMSKLTLEDANDLHCTFIWSSRKDSVVLSGPTDVQTHLDSRLYGYRSLTHDLKNLIAYMVGDTTQVTHLKPVKVVLADQ